MEKVKISITVTNWNGGKLTRDCLFSIKKYTSLPYELIIVDNGSTDGSLEMIESEFPNAILIKNLENLGAVKAANQEIKITNGDYIVHLDNDTKVTKNWLENLIRVAKSDKKIGIVGCKHLFPNGLILHAGGWMKPNAFWFYGWKEADNGQYDEIKEVDWVSSACWLLKKSLIKKIGFLDESFSPIYFEETDYCLRAKKAGFKIVYTPKTVIFHVGGISRDMKFSNEKIFFISQRNKVRFMLLNYPLNWLLKRFGREIGFAIKTTLQGRGKILLKAYLANLKNLKEILDKRRKRDQFLYQ